MSIFYEIEFAKYILPYPVIQVMISTMPNQLAPILFKDL